MELSTTATICVPGVQGGQFYFYLYRIFVSYLIRILNFHPVFTSYIITIIIVMCLLAQLLFSGPITPVTSVLGAPSSKISQVTNYTYWRLHLSLQPNAGSVPESRQRAVTRGYQSIEHYDGVVKYALQIATCYTQLLQPLVWSWWIKECSSDW